MSVQIDWSKLSKCDDVPSCTGHLGKFNSCLTEALYERTLDGDGDSTGSTEAFGHFTLLQVAATDTRHVIDPDGDAREVDVPAGWYVVNGTESGAIYSTRYDSETEAREVYDAEDARYAEYSDVWGA